MQMTKTLSKYRTSVADSLSLDQLRTRFGKSFLTETITDAQVHEWCNLSSNLFITHGAIKKTPLKRNGVDLVANIWLNSSDAYADGLLIDGIQLPGTKDSHLRWPQEPASHTCTNSECKQPVVYNHAFCPHCGTKNKMRAPAANQKGNQVWSHPKVQFGGDRKTINDKVIKLFAWVLNDPDIYQRLLNSGLVRFQIEPLQILASNPPDVDAETPADDVSA